MLDLKSAYEILGLEENAEREDVEKRFEFLIKKAKALKAIQGVEETEDAFRNAEVEEFNLDEISAAYNRIISNEVLILEKEEEKRNPKRPNPIFKLLGVDEKKARNYIYYHKFYYIFGLIGVLILAYFIKTIVFQVQPDVNIAFVGNIDYTQSSNFESLIKNAIPDIKEVSIDGAQISGNSQSQMETAMLQKAMVLFAAAEIDVFILDQASFKRYGEQNAFYKLDELIMKMDINPYKYQGISLKPKDQEKESIYGIDMSGNGVFSESQIVGNEMIFAIGINAKHYDRAVKILEMLMNQ